MGRLSLALSLAVLVACGGDVSPPGPLGSPDYPEASLAITYEHPDTEPYTYSLTCADDTVRVDGADLDGAEACTALSDLEVSSRLLGEPTDRACTEVYGGPDTAVILGTLDGQEVDAVIDRTDGCGISDWDMLLDALLPPARGVEPGG